MKIAEQTCESFLHLCKQCNRKQAIQLLEGFLHWKPHSPGTEIILRLKACKRLLSFPSPSTSSRLSHHLNKNFFLCRHFLTPSTNRRHLLLFLSTSKRQCQTRVQVAHTAKFALEAIHEYELTSHEDEDELLETYKAFFFFSRAICHSSPDKTLLFLRKAKHYLSPDRFLQLSVIRLKQIQVYLYLRDFGRAFSALSKCNGFFRRINCGFFRYEVVYPHFLQDWVAEYDHNRTNDEISYFYLSLWLLYFLKLGYHRFLIIYFPRLQTIHASIHHFSLLDSDEQLALMDIFALIHLRVTVTSTPKQYKVESFRALARTTQPHFILIFLENLFYSLLALNDYASALSILHKTKPTISALSLPDRFLAPLVPLLMGGCYCLATLPSHLDLTPIFFEHALSATQNFELQCYCLLQLCLFYLYTSNFHKVELLLQRMHDQGSSLRSLIVTTLYKFIRAVYLFLSERNYSEAKQLLLEVVETCNTDLLDKNILSAGLKIIAEIAIQTGDYDDAHDHILAAMKMAQSSQDVVSLLSCCHLFGSVYEHGTPNQVSIHTNNNHIKNLSNDFSSLLEKKQALPEQIVLQEILYLY